MAALTTVVTGATGFLGRHLVAALGGGLDDLPVPRRLEDREVHVLSSAPSPEFDGLAADSVISHQVDLTDADQVDRFFAGIEADELFHLAWFNGESSNRYSDPANHDWVAVAENTVEQFARHGGRRAIVAGSCIEYGAAGGVLSESGPARPDTVYGRCKFDAGLRALAVAQDHPTLSVAIARIFFVLGRYEEPNRLVPHVIRQLLDEEPAELSAGTQRRDYMHAWDVALGLIALADSDLTGPVNIGMGKSVPVKSLAEEIGSVVGRPDLLWFGARPGGADTADEITADTTKLREATGWSPSLDLDRAVADVVDWWANRLGARVGDTDG